MLTPIPSRRALLICASARIAALVSAHFAEPGQYFVAMDAPTINHPMLGDNPLIACINVIAEVLPELVVLGPMEGDQLEILRKRLSSLPVVEVATPNEVIAELGELRPEHRALLDCKEDDLGRILWEGAPIVRKEIEDLICLEPRRPLDDIAVVNLAIATNAAFRVVQIGENDATQVASEDDYLRSIDPGRPTALGEAFRRTVGPHHAQLDLASYRTVTFVTKGISHGLAVPPNVTVAHVPHIRDLVRVFTNTMVYEADESCRSYTAVLCDPGFFPNSESRPVGRLFASRGWQARSLFDAEASYDALDLHFQWCPKDVVLLSSHGGEIDGQYTIWRFRDERGNVHVFECEEAVTFSAVRPDKQVQVASLLVPVRLDGISWDDDAGKQRIGAGDLLQRFTDVHFSDEAERIAAYSLPRVSFSNAVLLYGKRPYFFSVHGLGLRDYPLVFNNSCSSWFEISKRLLFAGARGYVCTARPVIDQVASDVGERFFEHALRGVPMAEALRLAAEESGAQGVYIYAGLPFSTLRSPDAGIDVAARWRRRVVQHALSITRRLPNVSDPGVARNFREAAVFLGRLAQGA